MKHLILFLFIISNQLYAQSIDQNERGPCGEIDSYLIVLNGLTFHPKEPKDNSAELDLEFCNTVQKDFYLNGINLTETIFTELGIKPKDCSQEQSLYTYQFSAEDVAGCIERITYSVALAIPIEVNGVIINTADEHNAELLSLNEENIKSMCIARRHGNRFLEIHTR